MAEPVNASQQLAEIRELVASAHNPEAERDLVRSWGIILLFTGILLLVVSLVLHLVDEDSPGFASPTYWADVLLNLGTEFVGAVTIFVLITFGALGAVSRRFPSPRTRRLFYALLMFGPGGYLFAVSIVYSSSGQPLLRFLGRASLNLVTELVGSLITFVVLEQLLRILDERERKVAVVLERLDAAATHIAGRSVDILRATQPNQEPTSINRRLQYQDSVSEVEVQRGEDEGTLVETANVEQGVRTVVVNEVSIEMTAAQHRLLQCLVEHQLEYVPVGELVRFVFEVERVTSRHKAQMRALVSGLQEKLSGSGAEIRKMREGDVLLTGVHEFKV